MEERIQMVDLHSQYLRIKPEIDREIHQVIDACTFVNGPRAARFAEALAGYTGSRHVITCGNGTDALLMALMALGLKPGDEVIVPAFTFAAPAEAIVLAGLVPVMVDVDPASFNVTLDHICDAVSPSTKAIIAVHLFGQPCDMEPILDFARGRGIHVIEDNAQSLGSVYTFRDGTSRHSGTMGTIGCTSFFPSKNLGCFGDGGAVFTDDDLLADRLRLIANHGQREKYRHFLAGFNSRLDELQAAVLEVKLKYLDGYCASRREAARYYTENLSGIDGLGVPQETVASNHVYNQYTIRIHGGRRDALREYLSGEGIPTAIHYPMPLHRQEAFRTVAKVVSPTVNAEELGRTVLSLPMHTELTQSQQSRIVAAIRRFFNN